MKTFLMFARRAPLFEFEFEEALFEFAYTRPPLALPLLFERPKTRQRDRTSSLPGATLRVARRIVMRRRGAAHARRTWSRVPLSVVSSYRYYVYSLTVMSPLKARRAPRFEYEYEEALFEYAYTRPPLA